MNKIHEQNITKLMKVSYNKSPRKSVGGHARILILHLRGQPDVVAACSEALAAPARAGVQGAVRQRAGRGGAAGAGGQRLLRPQRVTNRGRPSLAARCCCARLPKQRRTCCACSVLAASEQNDFSTPGGWEAMGATTRARAAAGLVDAAAAASAATAGSRRLWLTVHAGSALGSHN